MTEPRIIECPSRRFVGYTTPFIHGRSPETNAPKVIGALWELTCDGMTNVANRIDERAMFGVIWGEPPEGRSHPHELHYLAGVEVRVTDAPADVPEGMIARDVPACTLAVFEHHGPIMQIRRTLDLIYADWLPASKYEHSGIADVERYDDRFDPCGERSVMDYAISITPKTL